jgi:hypothetical protein
LIKNIFHAFFVFAVFAVLNPAFSQTTDSAADKVYLGMIEQSKAMSSDFDFAAVRTIYPRTRFFNPYGAMPKTDVPALFKAAQTGNPTALKNLEVYKQINFPLIEMHSGYLNHYNALKNPAQAAYHDWATTGFIRALLKTGDGKSAETAYDVLNIGEEYMLARNAHIDVTGQRIENKDGRVYDVLEGTNALSKKTDIWFDITDIFAKGPY